MSARFRAGALVAAALLCARPARAAAPPIVLVQPGDARSAALARDVVAALTGRMTLRTESLSEDRRSNPIEKGKLIAALQNAPLVIAIGNGPIGFVVGELEDAPVYYIGSRVAGAALANARAAVLLTYSAADVMQALPPGWKPGLGVLYTSGYEVVLREIRSAAAAAGVTLIERKVGNRELAREANDLLLKSKAVWILGDPLLSAGPGFEFLAEESLTQGIPLIGTDPDQIGKGVLLCSRPAAEALAERAGKSILGLVYGNARGGVELAPAGGTLLYHRRLADRFGVTASPSWIGQ